MGRIAKSAGTRWTEEWAKEQPREVQLEWLAGEIIYLHEQAEEAAETAIEIARRVGERLNQAKEMVAHGEWGAWLKGNLPCSERTAQGYMKLAKEWPTLTDKSKAQRVADLPIREAAKMLAKPRTMPEPEVVEVRIRGDQVEETPVTVVVVPRDEPHRGSQFAWKCPNCKLLQDARVDACEKCHEPNGRQGVSPEAGIPTDAGDPEQVGDPSIRQAATHAAELGEQVWSVARERLREIMLLVKFAESSHRPHVVRGMEDAFFAAEVSINAMERDQRHRDNLSLDDAERLRVAETAIRQFVRMALALQEVRSRGLYKGTHRNFYHYCSSKWNLSKEDVDSLMEFAERRNLANDHLNPSSGA